MCRDREEGKGNRKSVPAPAWLKKFIPKSTSEVPVISEFGELNPVASSHYTYPTHHWCSSSTTFSRHISKCMMHVPIAHCNPLGGLEISFQKMHFLGNRTPQAVWIAITPVRSRNLILVMTHLCIPQATSLLPMHKRRDLLHLRFRQRLPVDFAYSVTAHQDVHWKAREWCVSTHRRGR